jgi:hypothetical protein
MEKILTNMILKPAPQFSFVGAHDFYFKTNLKKNHPLGTDIPVFSGGSDPPRKTGGSDPPFAVDVKVALKKWGGLAEKWRFLYVLIILFLKTRLFK